MSDSAGDWNPLLELLKGNPPGRITKPWRLVAKTLDPLHAYLAAGRYSLTGYLLSFERDKGSGSVLLIAVATGLVECCLAWGRSVTRALARNVAMALAQLRTAIEQHVPQDPEQHDIALIRISTLFYICTAKPSLRTFVAERLVTDARRHAYRKGISLPDTTDRAHFRHGLADLLSESELHPQCVRPHEVDLVWALRSEVLGRGMLLDLVLGASTKQKRDQIASVLTRKLKMLPLRARHIVFSTPFDAFMGVGICLNALTLLLSDPFCDTKNEDGSICYVACTSTKSILEGHSCHRYQEIACTNIEFAVLLLFTCEQLLTLLATQVEYFGSPWNCVDGLAVVVSWYSLLSDGPSLTVVRLSRVFRLFSRVSQFKRLKEICEAICEATYALVSTLGVVILFIVVFSVSGIGLFKGSLRNQCFFLTTPDSPASMYLNMSLSEFTVEWTEAFGHLSSVRSIAAGQGTWAHLNISAADLRSLRFGEEAVVWQRLYEDTLWQMARPAECPYVNSPSCPRFDSAIGLLPDFLCSDLDGALAYDGRTCPVVNGTPTVCRSKQPVFGKPNPNPLITHDWVSFDDMGSALMLIYHALSAEGWADIMYLYEDASGVLLSRTFFIAMILMGQIFLIQLGTPITPRAHPQSIPATTHVHHAQARAMPRSPVQVSRSWRTATAIARSSSRKH